MFFEKFDVLCFLETPVLRFAFLSYYRRFMNEQGKPDLQFVIIESPEFTTEEGLKGAMKIAFSRTRRHMKIKKP